MPFLDNKKGQNEGFWEQMPTRENEAKIATRGKKSLKLRNWFKGAGSAAGKRAVSVGKWGKAKAKGWWQKRKEAKAAQQAAQPASASYYPEARGLYGMQPKRQSIFASAGKKGAAIAMIFLLIAILLFFLQFFGAFPRFPFGIFFTFELILLVLAVLSAILVGISGSGSAAAGVFFIIFILSFASGWLTTPLGQQMSGEIGVAGIQAGEQARILTGPLTVTSQIFKGTYNPENLWRSDQVQSEYKEVKDVGVRILSAEPIRDPFDTSQVPVIQGRVDAVSFPGREVTVDITAREIDAVTGQNLMNWPPCEKPFETVKEARNRPFTCRAPSILTAKAHAIEISALSKGTQAVAGKQFVVVDPDVIMSMEPGADVLRELGISRDAVQSWQTGDDSIELGIGVSGDYDVLEAGSLEYYIGVNVENPASHTGVATITKIELFIPKTPDLQIGDGNNGFTCTERLYDEDFRNLDLQGYENIGLKKCYIIGTIELPAGKREVKIMQIKIDPDELNKQDFSTFFVLARAEFNYENMKTVPILVESLTSGGELIAQPS